MARERNKFYWICCKEDMAEIIYPKQAIACVSTIVYSKKENNVFILIQERWKKKGDIYNGKIEIPAGVLDIEYENIIDAVKREVKEEASIDVKRVLQNEEIIDFENGDKMAIINPFCISQQLVGGKPYVCSAFVCEADYLETKAQDIETRNNRWIQISELESLAENRDLFFPLVYPIIKKFLSEYKNLI